jgi:Zn-dependent alcohol dehydrogenase
MSVTYNVVKGSASKQLVESSVTHELESHQVYIETTHSGLCGTDEHYLGADQALGHEGVGIIRQVGSGVKSVKVGERVGFGYTHEVCANCDNCAQGKSFPVRYVITKYANRTLQQVGTSSVETRSSMDSTTLTTALSALVPFGMRSVSIPSLRATIPPMQLLLCVPELQSGRS